MRSGGSGGRSTHYSPPALRAPAPILHYSWRIAAHCSRRLERPAVAKHREACVEALKLLREKAVAPVERAVQRPMPGGLIVMSADEKPEPGVELRQHLRGRQDLYPGRRKLQRQRN